MTPEATTYIRHVAESAVDELADGQARRIACMEPPRIPLLLATDVYERCQGNGEEGFELLRREIHRRCCERVGLRAA